MSVMRVTLRPALMQTGYCREIALHSQPRRKLPWEAPGVVVGVIACGC